jgi:LmbE family N-acetylglucosaminyl deacetylase
MNEPKFSPLQPKIILGVVAHPDDLEFGMAGTVARYASEGAAVYYYVLTNANKGSEDRTISPDTLRDLRRQEQRDAAGILGVKDVFFAEYEDGMLEVTQDLKRDIVRMIRRLKPDTVLTFDPTMVYATSFGAINHTDHRAAGQATLDAVYPLARDHLSYPEICEDEHLEPHKVKTVLMLNFEKQNFYVDISEHMDTKLKALGAHASQVTDTALEWVRQQAEQAGTHVGAKYAEGFVRLDIR